MTTLHTSALEVPAHRIVVFDVSMICRLPSNATVAISDRRRPDNPITDVAVMARQRTRNDPLPNRTLDDARPNSADPGKADGLPCGLDHEKSDGESGGGGTRT